MRVGQTVGNVLYHFSGGRLLLQSALGCRVLDAKRGKKNAGRYRCDRHGESRPAETDPQPHGVSQPFWCRRSAHTSLAWSAPAVMCIPRASRAEWLLSSQERGLSRILGCHFIQMNNSLVEMNQSRTSPILPGGPAYFPIGRWLVGSRSPAPAPSPLFPVPVEFGPSRPYHVQHG